MSMRFTVEVTDEDMAGQIRAAVEAGGVSQREWVRRAIRAYLGQTSEAALGPSAPGPSAPGPAQDTPSPPSPSDTPAAQAAYLAALEEVIGPDLAARHAGVDPEEVDGWLESDTVFRRRAARAQRIGLEAAQHRLLLVGRGEARGNASALIALLGACHDAYGLVRQGYVRKLLKGVMGKVRDALVAVLPKNAEGRKQLELLVGKLRGIGEEAIEALPE